MSDTLTLLKKIDGSVEAHGKRVEGIEKRLQKIEETPAVSVDSVLAAAKGKGSTEEGRFGFKSLGHFAHEVYQSSIAKRPTETLTKAFGSEMVIKAAAGMGEVIGSDGGFLVPPEFSNKLLERMYAPNTLLEMTDKYTTKSNSLSFPRNAETSRATGSRYGGVRGYWLNEGDQITKSAPKFGRLTLNLHKLACLARVTEELMQDSETALEQYLFRAFTDELNFLVGDAIMNGTGAGQPMGIVGASSAVSVAKESGQLAATLNPQNIAKMWSRMWAPCRSKAVWLINQDIEPQLNLMTLGIGTAGIAVYMPPGSLSSTPYATIMGRPVMAIEQCQTLGTVGDIVLADLSHYVTLTKGAPQTAVSMHFYFDTDEQAFKVTFRIDGSSWWASALTPFKGSNTQSHIVTLDTRA